MNLLATTAKDIQVEVEDWPRCAVCDMPVQEFRVTDTGDSIVFVAACHGQTELAMLPDSMWDTITSTHVNFGRAFEKTEDPSD